MVQNSIDACLARQELANEAYSPTITMDAFTDENERRWIRIKDSGIGMDEYVIGEYFLTLGNTYYDSPEFEKSLAIAGKSKKSFVPISRFGVGIASVFMISDIMEIRTCRYLSPRHDKTKRFVRVERLGGLAYLLEEGIGEPGTEISIRLKNEFNSDYFLTNCLSYLRDVVVRPAVPVKVSIMWTTVTIRKGDDLKVSSHGTEVLKALGVTAVRLELKRWSNILGGTVIVFFAENEGKLSISSGGRKLIIANDPYAGSALHINPARVLQGYGGNRIVVNGFRMSLKKMAKVFGDSKQRLLCIFDIDVLGTEEIAYDVSRDKIVHEGIATVKNELRRTINAGLNELGIFERLDSDSKKHLEKTMNTIEIPFRPSRMVVDKSSSETTISEETLSEVLKLLPSSAWPIGIHKTISQSLRISNQLAYRAITQLISTGKVAVPKPDGDR